jgi:hypothetical protein
MGISSFQKHFVSYHLDLKKYPKNISKNIPHFLGVRDDFNYEKEID